MPRLRRFLDAELVELVAQCPPQLAFTVAGVGRSPQLLHHQHGRNVRAAVDVHDHSHLDQGGKLGLGQLFLVHILQDAARLVDGQDVPYAMDVTGT